MQRLKGGGRSWSFRMFTVLDLLHGVLQVLVEGTSFVLSTLPWMAPLLPVIHRFFSCVQDARFHIARVAPEARVFR